MLRLPPPADCCKVLMESTGCMQASPNIVAIAPDIASSKFEEVSFSSGCWEEEVGVLVVAGGSAAA